MHFCLAISSIAHLADEEDTFPDSADLHSKASQTVAAVVDNQAGKKVKECSERTCLISLDP